MQHNELINDVLAATGGSQPVSCRPIRLVRRSAQIGEILQYVTGTAGTDTMRGEHCARCVRLVVL